MMKTLRILLLRLRERMKKMDEHFVWKFTIFGKPISQKNSKRVGLAKGRAYMYTPANVKKLPTPDSGVILLRRRRNFSRLARIGEWRRRRSLNRLLMSAIRIMF